MGRRGVKPTDDGRWVFNRLAPVYGWRPPYPAALVSRLVTLAGGPQCHIADVGAGSGLLALPLTAAGARVTAIEPARKMLALLEAASPKPGSLTCVQAAAESTGLADRSIDLWLAADSLQWMDPELTGREARRVLVPGGALAVVDVSFADTEPMREVRRIMTLFNPKARTPETDGLRAVLLGTATLQGWTAERFDDERVLDEVALEGMVRSFSFVGPALGPTRLAELFGAIRGVGGTAGLTWSRAITLSWARS